MTQTAHTSTSRFKCIAALIGLALMTGVLLEDGQARTYSPSVATNQVSKLDASAHAVRIHQTQPPKPTVKEQGPTFAIQTEAKKHPAKKRMGLAMLFLGILAEKG